MIKIMKLVYLEHHIETLANNLNRHEEKPAIMNSGIECVPYWLIVHDHEEENVVLKS
jgi:phosphoribosylaminoimidazole carboxylase (NCAIR synthetase)